MRTSQVWIETTGKYPYLVTQMESDGEVFNFRLNTQRRVTKQCPLYNYLLNLSACTTSMKATSKSSRFLLVTRGGCFINFAVPGTTALARKRASLENVMRHQWRHWLIQQRLAQA